jgi:hypothetical protein
LMREARRLSVHLEAHVVLGSSSIGLDVH